MRSHALPSFVCFSLVALGCGSSNDAPIAIDDSGADDTFDAAPPDDASTNEVSGDDTMTDSAPADAADAEPPPPPGHTLDTTRRVGVIWGGEGQGGNLAFAGFGASPGGWTVDFLELACDPGTLVETRSGSCVRLSCVTPTDVLQSSAGTITLTSSGPTPDLTLRYPEYRSTSDAEGKPASWVAGTSITVASTGSKAIPAFSTTIVQPPDAKWKVASGTPVTDGFQLAPGEDIAIDWDGTLAFDDFRMALLSQLPVGTKEIEESTVECIYPASAGHGVIPRAMFDDFDGALTLDAFGENLDIVPIAGGDPVLVSAWFFNPIPRVFFAP